MQLRWKVLLLAAVPLLLALAAVVWTVRHQADQLAQAQIAAVQPILLQARKDELAHFVRVGLRAIAYLVDQKGDVAAAQQQALALLRRMDFDEDSYFFVYDQNGNSLMHPRLPQLEGRSQWELRDAAGGLTIQQLVARAQSGGGFVDYLWHRPSTQRVERKLGYVEFIPAWGWVVGTGLYLDHLQETQALISSSTAAAIVQTRNQILLIALAALLLVAGGGFALNLVEHSAADAKLRAMAQKVVLSQEAERSRVSRELHDGISQWLVSVKFVFESALVQVQRGGEGGDAVAVATLRNGLALMQGVMRDVRRISHDLRPTLLDDVGLAGAVTQIAREFGERTGILVDARTDGLPLPLLLPDAVATAVFRVVQEALGNVEKHAEARHVALHIRHDSAGLQLELRDDGKGFDVQASQRQVREGLGLTHMRERIETLGGQFSLQSAPGATVLTANLPPKALQL